MKILLFGLVALCAVSMVLCNLPSILAKDPSKPGDCFSDTTGPMNNGETKPWGRCGIVECSSNGDLVFHTCGVVAGRTTKPDLSKPYPDCC